MHELGAARTAGREKPEMRAQHRRRLPYRLERAARRLLQHDIADRDGVVRARIFAEQPQPARRLGQIAYNRLLGDAASMNKPGPEGRKARIFLSDVAHRHQSTVAQELKKCSSATPPPNHSRRGQRAAFARKKALAIVLSETLHVRVIHIPRPNPRQAEPMRKVLGGRDEHASASSAVAQDDEVIAIGGQ
jgi:hypothetical protein